MKLVKDGEEVKNEHGHGITKIIRDAALIAAVATAVKVERRVIVRELATANGASNYTIHKILQKESKGLSWQRTALFSTGTIHSPRGQGLVCRQHHPTA